MITYYKDLNSELRKMEFPRLLTETQVSERTDIPISTLKRHRHLRRGLPYVKIGPRLVRYNDAEVVRYISEHTIHPEEND